jgi:hypothetical protein
MRDNIEFYSAKGCVATVHSSVVPHIGSKISIRKKNMDGKKHYLRS